MVQVQTVDPRRSVVEDRRFPVARTARPGTLGTEVLESQVDIHGRSEEACHAHCKVRID
jgi:hypothetical protein